MKVFISHTFSDEDQPLATTLQKILAEENIDGYLAEKKKEYDLLIRDKIRKEIENSDHMIAIVTNKARESASVNQEIGYALSEGIKPVIMLEENAKEGVLTHGIEPEFFTRSNFENHCFNVRNFILSKGNRNKISEKEKTWLKESVYRPLYNSMIKNLKDIDQFNKVTENPWDTLEPYVQLKIEDDVKQLVENYAEELRKYENMLSESEASFIANQVKLGEIIRPAFEQVGLIKEYGQIKLDNRTTQEPKQWVNAFRFIIFDRTVTDEQVLYDKLLEHSIKTKNGHSGWLEKWKQQNPNLFFNIFKVIPNLRNTLQITATPDDLHGQKTLLSISAEQLTIKLEEKLK